MTVLTYACLIVNRHGRLLSPSHNIQPLGDRGPIVVRRTPGGGGTAVLPIPLEHDRGAR